MQHCDPDVLALVALGERPAPADAEHLLGCEQCQADVEQLRQVVSQVDLKNLQPDVTEASGSAEVVRTDSGNRLVLDVSKLKPTPGHFYEVWLIDNDIKKMVSLGILDGATAEFAIPDGVDVSKYPIVDISVQQPGDPKHSGDSLLRGVIKA